MRFIPIFISLFLLSGCYQTESNLTDTLVYCAEKAPNTFNPQISHDVATLDATTHQLYNRLIKIDPISQRYIADIATHWEINEEKTTYTFFLRKDINFHQTDYFSPTRQLNADDVIFSFQRMLSNKHPFHSVNSESANSLYTPPFVNLVRDIIKLDQYTVRFQLKKPNATIIANLAAHYSVIHSQEYGQQLLESGKPEQIDYLPIGTGPYQFRNSTNRVIRYQAHKRPWMTPVQIDSLIFDITINSTKRYAKLLSGECDIMTNPAPSQVTQISKNKSVSLSSQPTSNGALISFNSQKPPFNDAYNRKALSTAIDINTVLEAVFFDTAVASNNLLPEHSWAFNPRIEKSEYSPEQSIKDLNNNGFDFSKKLRIITPIKSSLFNSNFLKIAELIQANWADVGVTSEIVLLRHSDLQLALQEGDYDLYLAESRPYNKDPDNLFRPLISCDVSAIEGNSSRWCDIQMQNLLDNTLVETNFIQRIKNYYQLQELLQQQRIYLPVAHLLRFDVFNENISNLHVDSLTGIDFYNVKKVPPTIKIKVQ